MTLLHPTRHSREGGNPAHYPKNVFPRLIEKIHLLDVYREFGMSLFTALFRFSSAGERPLNDSNRWSPGVTDACQLPPDDSRSAVKCDPNL